MGSEDGEHDPKRQPRTPLEWFNGVTDRNRTRMVREQDIPSGSVVGSDIRLYYDGHHSARQGEALTEG